MQGENAPTHDLQGGTAVLFPGQGIPANVLLETVPEADPLIELAGDLLGQNLLAPIRAAAQEGRFPPTTSMQPAILVAGLHLWRAGEGVDAPWAFAGHSMGEYTALAAAGAITPEDAVRVLIGRARAMDEVARTVPGGMAAILRLSDDAIREIAEEAGAFVANDNAPGQIVISGMEDALERAERLTGARGGAFKRLEIVGPFHSPLAGIVVEPLREALDAVDIKEPAHPIVSNVTGDVMQAPAEIRQLLLDNLLSGVQWRTSIEWMWRAGARQFNDVGPGNVVGKLAKRIVGELQRGDAMASSDGPPR